MERFKFYIKYLNELSEVEDSDIGNRSGSQPKEYYKGLKKSTKLARNKHFKRGAEMDDDNPLAYEPAPGDKIATTKLSKHTKKYKEMFGEENMNCPPATQDVELNTKNRNLTIKNHMYGPLNVDEPADYWEKIAEKWDTSEEAAKKSKCGNCVAFDISERMEKCMPGPISDDDGKLGYCWMHHFKCHSARSCDTWAKGGPITENEKSISWQEKAFNTKNNEAFEIYKKETINEEIEGLKNKSEKSGISYSILKQVYDRGIAAWRTGHRPGTTPQQWAFARVNSFITGGKTRTTTDKDLWSKTKTQKESYTPMELALLEGGHEITAELQLAIDENSCWKGYKQIGMKKKNGKKVPNCVPEETYHGDEFFEAYGILWFDEEETLSEAEYQGSKVTLGKPMQGDVKKFKVYVKDPETGNVKKVNFGDPNMRIRKSNPAARKSFRARHRCEDPGPKTMARYWSCKKW